MSKLKLINPPAYEAHQSALALTFEAEIKRISNESGAEMSTVMEELSNASGISQSQIYNYRIGKCDIPGSLIRIFCAIFKSNALSDVTRCEDIEFELDGDFDLAQMCNRHVRQMLECGQAIMEAAEDGHFDGHEVMKVERKTAELNRTSFQLVEYARHSRRRIIGNNTPPLAA